MSCNSNMFTKHGHTGCINHEQVGLVIIHHTLFCQLREITKSLLTNQHKMPTANVNISENFKAVAKRKYFNLNWIGQLVTQQRSSEAVLRTWTSSKLSFDLFFFSHFGSGHCFILNIDKLGPWEASTAEITVKKENVFPQRSWETWLRCTCPLQLILCPVTLAGGTQIKHKWVTEYVPT